MKIYLFLLLFTVGLSSCTHRLVGSWTVQKFETSTRGQSTTIVDNSGTMVFQKNGHGLKDVSYQMHNEGRVQDNIPFTWAVSDNFVTVQSSGSFFGKVWVQVIDKKRFQRWKSTDGADQVQILELRKN